MCCSIDLPQRWQFVELGPDLRVSRVFLSWFSLYFLASLSRSVLVSKEPGERQLPKQDEPMEVVPCSNGGGVGSLLPTSVIFMRLHVIL